MGHVKGMLLELPDEDLIPLMWPEGSAQEGAAKLLAQIAEAKGVLRDHEAASASERLC